MHGQLFPLIKIGLISYQGDNVLVHRIVDAACRQRIALQRERHH